MVKIRGESEEEKERREERAGNLLSSFVVPLKVSFYIIAFVIVFQGDITYLLHYSCLCALSIILAILRCLSIVQGE